MDQTDSGQIWQRIRSKPELLQHMAKEFCKLGNNLGNALQEQLDQWTKELIHCAVLGETGAGKSSFINTIRGLSADDEGACHVAVTDGTRDCTPYPDPQNALLQYWDVPGVGSPQFSKDVYFDRIDFDRYDFFVIISATRFTENDYWLAQEIKGRGKKFFFVRSKIDQDVQNQRLSHPRTFDDRTTINRVREECCSHLQHINGNEVFLISNFHPWYLDFPRLLSDLINALPQIKQEAMALSLPFFTEERFDFLWQRLLMVSIIPSLNVTKGTTFDMAVKEMGFYKEKFVSHFRGQGRDDQCAVIEREMQSTVDILVDGSLLRLESSAYKFDVTEDALAVVKELDMGSLNRTRFQAVFGALGGILFKLEMVLKNVIVKQTMPLRIEEFCHQNDHRD